MAKDFRQQSPQTQGQSPAVTPPVQRPDRTDDGSEAIARDIFVSMVSQGLGGRTAEFAAQESFKAAEAFMAESQRRRDIKTPAQEG
jgi:hypothetical protein